MPVPLLASSRQKLSDAPITVKFTVNAYARLQAHCLASNITPSELVRNLVKTGWAVHFDGQDFDMPLGYGIKLAKGVPGANGAADLPLVV